MYLKHRNFRIRNGNVKRSSESYAYQYAVSDIKTEALNAILASTKEVVSDMNAMVSWWTLVIDALGKVEDATHRMRGTSGIDDSAVMVSITRITRALDSYCEAVSLSDHSGDIIQSDRAIVRGVPRRIAQGCFGNFSLVSPLSACLYKAR